MLIGINLVPAAPRNNPAGCVNDAERYYLRKVMDAVHAREETIEFIVFAGEDGPAPDGWPVQRVPGSGGLQHALGRRTPLERAVREAGADLLISGLKNACLRPPVPQVVHLLDLAPWQHLSGREPQTREMKRCRRICAEAPFFITTTEYARKRCLKLFEAPLNRIITAPPGVEAVFSSPGAPLIEPPYIFVYTDELTAGKPEQIREAFSRRETGSEHTLVVAGPGAGEEPDHWGEGIVRIEQCPDATLAGLYHHSALFVYPALYDTCALRVIQALRAGACAVTPHNPCVDELTGNIPFYYEPGAKGEFLNAVRRALGLQGDARRERLRLGQSITSEYTWDRTAWKIIAALRGN
jgi:glycosyltransferase involved in cell wall biosynthesis